ncbi:MAG: hypothetical protein WCT52_06090 [Candidatus Micrarchaeia archaeon]
MEFSRKGQGATEYLVLLAVVLIIALVSIALLGFFPSLAIDARVTQANLYWRGEARPFAITDYTFAATGGNGTIIMQNTDAGGSMRVDNISITSCAGINATFIVASGDTRTVTLTGCPSTDLTAGSVYDYNVSISYTTNGGSGIGTRQIGTKGLVGKYT